MLRSPGNMAQGLKSLREEGHYKKVQDVEKMLFMFCEDVIALDDERKLIQASQEASPCSVPSGGHDVGAETPYKLV